MEQMPSVTVSGFLMVLLLCVRFRMRFFSAFYGDGLFELLIVVCVRWLWFELSRKFRKEKN